MIAIGDLLQTAGHTECNQGAKLILHNPVSLRGVVVQCHNIGNLQLCQLHLDLCSSRICERSALQNGMQQTTMYDSGAAALTRKL